MTPYILVRKDPATYIFRTKESEVGKVSVYTAARSKHITA